MSKYRQLTDAEADVILHKGTEAPYSGEYTDFTQKGTYYCKQCSAPLYRSEDKFHSGCGWPSFDDEIPEAVKRIPDKDGRRTELVCNQCGGHLGHVFNGEGFTPKNSRHCINSISLIFKEESEKSSADAWFAGGCFWGVEHLLQQIPGVISAISGYMGGSVKNPTYHQVCTGTTGHTEAVRVIYNPSIIDYESLARHFFEIHDPTQLNHQGPDRGPQYRSAVFVENDPERQIIIKLIEELKGNGFNPVTEINEYVTFYPAEKYHQDYYERRKSEPYCHSRIKRF